MVVRLPRGPGSALHPAHVSVAWETGSARTTAESVLWMSHCAFGASTHSARVASLVQVFEKALHNN